MHKPSLLVAVLLLVFTSASAQLNLEGIVLSQRDRKPVSFANIGIVNTNVGTISNEDGTFSIRIPKHLKNDTLIFSALGYGRRVVAIASVDASNEIKVYLREKAIDLEAVTVTANKEKAKSFELGNRYFKGGVLLADSMYAGSAMALLIRNKYPSFYEDFSYPAYVKKARVRILKNNMKSFRLRLRLYDVDSTSGQPGKDFLHQNVILESEMRKGWLEFDLSHLNVKVTKDFFVVFEWLLDDDDRRHIIEEFRNFRRDFPHKITTDSVLLDGKKVPRENMQWADFPGTALAVSPIQFSRDHYVCYTRDNSFGEWKRSNGILTARVEMSNQPLQQKEPVTIYRKSKEMCDAICQSQILCEQFLEENSVYGAQLVVSVKNKVVLSQAFGLADIESNLPTTRSTQFRIGSVSKSVTSAALAKLVSEKKLDLDAPIQKYVPSFPEKKYPITTRQLAGHLAGIRHYHERDPHDLTRKEHYSSATEALAIFKHDTLLFKPGERFNYSSFGWNLIGAIIEGASGDNYLQYMKRHIWKPLGMQNTYGELADSVFIHKSKFYAATGEEAPFEDLSYKYAGGGLISTAEDLVKFGNALLHGNHFDSMITKNLFETQFTSDHKPTGYGMGWYIGFDKNGHRIWFHAGDLLNSSAFLYIYPDDDIVVAFTANSQQGLRFEIQKIGALFYQGNN